MVLRMDKFLYSLEYTKTKWNILFYCISLFSYVKQNRNASLFYLMTINSVFSMIYQIYNVGLI